MEEISVVCAQQKFGCLYSRSLFFFFSLYWPLAFLITFSHHCSFIEIRLFWFFVCFFACFFLSLALVLFCIIHVSVKRELRCKDLATYNIMCENKFQSPTVTIN